MTNIQTAVICATLIIGFESIVSAIFKQSYKATIADRAFEFLKMLEASDNNWRALSETIKPKGMS